MADTQQRDQHLEHIDRALKFFGPTPPVETHRLAAEAVLAAGNPENFTAQTGLMKFVFNDQSIAADPDVVNKVEDAKRYLKGMMSLVTAKLFGDNKNNVDAAFNIPPSAVKDIAVHLPLLSGFASGQYKSSQSRTVAQFSADFITAILDVSLENYPGAIDKVVSFLQHTGDKITASAKADLSSYNITVFSGVIGVTKVGGVIDIEPAFQIAGASLSVTDIKAQLKNCGSAGVFTLNFDAPYFRAPFNYDALEDKATRDKMDSLITKSAADQIDKSGSYFGL